MFDKARFKRAQDLYHQSRPLRTARTNHSFCTSVVHYPFNRQNIYHWWIDSLPRLFFLSRLAQLGIDSLAILVAKDSPKYQIDSLDALVGDNKNCVSLELISENEKWRCPRFIVPTFVTGHQNGFLHPEIVDYIRERLFHYYSIVPRGGKRIYISRQRARRMRVVNEEELLPILKRFDVDMVTAEDLPYSDQIALFASADLVIGAHGAGLNNVLFCPPGACLFELHSADQIRSHYLFLSKSLDMEYRWLVAGLQQEQGFVVDPEMFAGKLAECVGGSRLAGAGGG